MPTHRDIALTIGAMARELGEPIHRVEELLHPHSGHQSRVFGWPRSRVRR